MPSMRGRCRCGKRRNAGDAKALFEVGFALCRRPRHQVRHEGRREMVREGCRARACAGAVPHRQFLREGHRRRPRRRQGEDLVPDGRRAGQCQRHAQSCGAVCDGRRRHGRQRLGRALVHQAAELGVKDSQFNLGILSAKGVGMPQSLEESYKWFALVAKTGDRDAATKRDEIANALRPEQLERARAAAELWKAKPVDAETNSVDIPESWQRKRRQDGKRRHEEGGQNIQIDPQQERLRCRLRRRRHGREDQARHRRPSRRTTAWTPPAKSTRSWCASCLRRNERQARRGTSRLLHSIMLRNRLRYSCVYDNVAKFDFAAMSAQERPTCAGPVTLRDGLVDGQRFTIEI